MRNLLFTFFCLTTLLSLAGGIWEEGSQWDIWYTPGSTGIEDSTDVENVLLWVSYRLLRVDDTYMALEKTENYRNMADQKSMIQGYIRNEGDSLIYVRPVLEDSIIGDECLLYDFREPYEYGSTVRYGVMGGEIRQEYIDWQEDTLDYYMLDNGDTHCLPAWRGVIYKYGYIEGPMDLFLLQAAPSKKKHPKPTNISHVIYSTKGGHKTIGSSDWVDDGPYVTIPYDNMLTDGSTWEFLAVSTDQPDLSSTYTIQVKGDTLVGNRCCKQIYSPEYDIQKTLFEEAPKVYLVNEDGNPEVLLDFNLQEGDKLDEVTSVVDVWGQENLGNLYQTITIDMGFDCESYFTGDSEPWVYHLIEGIGASKDQYLKQRFVNKENTFSYLLKRWQDGTLVYKVPGYDSVEEVFTESESNAIYDLQGHRLKTIPQKGIYIIGNKKLLIQ